jgi:DNA-directed RNA polymerase subunit RPC12/RpoP
MEEGVRQFPCGQCGAKVEFAPRPGSLQCPYCGHQTAIPESDEGFHEQDFHRVLANLEAGTEMEEVQTVTCASCAASVEPAPSAEAFPCPYCGSSIVATAKSERLIKPQALLPFLIERGQATGLFRKWISKLWFAPDALKKLARLDDRLQGLYAPYWTYDSRTSSEYRGQRGDDYRVTKTRRVSRNGKMVTETYTDTQTRWTPVGGTVGRDFDDVLVVGSRSLPRSLAEELEPWDIGSLVTYADDYLSGFQAERYQIGLAEGWTRAGERMEQVIRGDVRRDIGGDHQRITSLRTRHDEVTFKHVLLPLWICSYRYREKIYRFLVNARTGEVQGQRPWSWVKIMLTALMLTAVAVVIYQATR